MEFLTLASFIVHYLGWQTEEVWAGGQSEWKQSESKQRARYYRITAKGKKQLASDLDRWEQIVEAIGSVMYVKPEESAS